ncbi:MAG: formate dehydrogenase accessory protein FdhE [Methylocystaceae bacterium]|nr:MAG: formate dehydrogenase accessory protein FdhE [Methylocystaceae bacterium]
MPKVRAPGPDPTQIGDVSAPAFAVLPDPAALFSRRAARFATLAQSHPLAPYLSFLAALSAVQRDLLDDLPEPAAPSPDDLARAREFGMPPLNRARFAPDAAFGATLDRLFDRCGSIPAPEAATAALARVASADAGARLFFAQNVLADAIPMDALAEHVFVAAALQIHFARLAARLDPATLVPVADGVCPACGGAPGVSLVVGWQGAHGARFCSCSSCATLWNYVRIRCTACGSTKGVGYREIEGGSGAIKAECCDECGSYLKILYQTQDPALDPVADDVASLGLDLLVREGGSRRFGVNPYSIGY